MKKKQVVFMILFIVLTMSVVFAGGQQEGAAAPDDGTLKPATYSWTAGGMGGGWYTTAGGMSAIVNNAENAITIKVIPGGGVVNPVKLDSKQDDFGWGVSFVDKAAYSGTAPLFDREYSGFRGLAGGFSVDFYHFFAAKNTGVTTLDEFIAKVKNGEKVNVAGPMAGTSERALTSLIFEHYGISYEMMEKNGGKVIYAVYGDMVNLYKDRHVDYVIACLGLPGAAITEMAVSRESTILSVTDDLINYCADTFGTVALDTGLCVIPAGTYSGIDKDVQALGHTTEICATVDLPEIVAYTFVKTLMENIDSVQQLSPSFAKYFSKENAYRTVVPLHPGAERYYREAGILK